MKVREGTRQTSRRKFAICLSPTAFANVWQTVKYITFCFVNLARLPKRAGLYARTRRHDLQAKVVGDAANDSQATVYQKHRSLLNS